MAAPINEHSNSKTVDVCKRMLVNNNDLDTSHTAEDRSCMGNVGEMVEREIGGDLKSLKKVKGLLEKLRAENKVLEEQVRHLDTSSVTHLQ